MTDDSNGPRVLFVCTGVGVLNRGIESFFREAYDNLHDIGGMTAIFVKGAGQRRDDEIIARCLPRTSRIAELIGALTKRNGYVVEQWSSFFSVANVIRKFKPGVVFYSDANLGFLLYRFRKQIGVPYRLLFSNGGPCHAPFHRTDFVHQVTPYHYQLALRAGEPATRHIMVPYGIKVDTEPPVLSTDEVADLRRSLNIPTDRKILLSVGWISAEHKRMDYLVEELAAIPNPRPYLILLGNMTKNSEKILELANAKLGAEGYVARSVPYAETRNYYKCADCFALASLEEGFGRVFVEALNHGLRIVAHDHPVMQYVLGEHCVLGDLRKKGSLSDILSRVMNTKDGPREKNDRWTSVKNRFSWTVLSSGYKEMFEKAQNAQLPISLR